jgi:hypothetical protein
MCLKSYTNFFTLQQSETTPVSKNNFKTLESLYGVKKGAIPAWFQTGICEEHLLLAF